MDFSSLILHKKERFVGIIGNEIFTRKLGIAIIKVLTLEDLKHAVLEGG